jgi:DnaJ homolog subfamily C member 28
LGKSFLRWRAERALEAAREHGKAEPQQLEPVEAEPEAAGHRARPKAGPGGWGSLVEQRIQDGIERGLFDNLPGAGKPLNLEEDALVPEDMRMAFRLLRSNGLAPLWVELNKEIRDDIERLARFRTYVHERLDRSNFIQWEHRRNEYIDRVNDINAKITNYNILAPSPQVHLRILLLDDELAKFDAG